MSKAKQHRKAYRKTNAHTLEGWKANFWQNTRAYWQAYFTQYRHWYMIRLLLLQVGSSEDVRFPLLFIVI